MSTSLSHKSVAMFRICPVCDNMLVSSFHYLGVSVESTVIYLCEHPICRDVYPYTRYKAAYENDIECVSAQIILNIDNKNYRIAFNSIKNITKIDKIYLIETGSSTSLYAHKEICTLNYVVPWYNALSAHQVITRILKIKAFS